MDIQNIVQIVITVACVIGLLWSGIFIGREFGSFESFVIALADRLEIAVNQNRRISTNEQMARTLLTQAIRMNVGVRQLPDANGCLPCLTDRECISMAKNYPFSWTEIRQMFPKA